MKRGPVIPSLFAPNINRTIKFYVDEFGFTQTGHWVDKDQITWTELSYKSASLWFFKNPLDDYPTPAMSGFVYLLIEDVDQFASSMGANVEIRWGPQNQEYGLRELGVYDDNGYTLVFAQELDA